MKGQEPVVTQRDRDIALEETYSFHRSWPRESVVAHVSTNRETLALDFFDWKVKQPFASDDISDMLVRFEEERFGRALEPVAHGMLLFTVKYRMDHLRTPPDVLFGSDTQRMSVEDAASKLEPIEGEGSEARVTRIATAAGLIESEKQKAPHLRLVRPIETAPAPAPAPEETPQPTEPVWSDMDRLDEHWGDSIDEDDVWVEDQS